jgi:predicted enzyme related to lactoylglutathione lyase
MPEVTRHEPGRFCWAELSTTDTAGAKAFYTGLFGWQAEDTPAGPDMVYTLLKVRGLDVGALYPRQKEEAEHGIPPHWNVYISVESADKSAATAKELGGTIMMPPFDVMVHGRMAVVQDPTGAVICLWEARKHVGIRIENEPNTPCWCELLTTDTAKAGAFYSKLFGWRLKESPDYTEFHVGDRGIGGMLKIKPEMGPMPPNWAPYFQVADCSAAVQKAKSLGGKIYMGPMDIPDVGPFAVVADPQGAVFDVIELRRKG